MADENFDFDKQIQISEMIKIYKDQVKTISQYLINKFLRNKDLS